MEYQYDDVFTYSNLMKSYKLCLKGVRWKGTVQKYRHTSVSELYKTYDDLMSRDVKTGKFFKFTIMERGKVRHIKSVPIQERVVQRCFCDNCLVPALSRKFIYDNAACIKGKGMHFAIKRLKRYLHNYWLKTGSNDLYILQYDFHHYFDTIPHQELIDMVSKELKDKDLCNLYAQLVNDFDGDKGLGLGSQISQISALYYPHEIDNTFAYDKKLIGYARYMDDGYLLCEDKDYLLECLEKLKALCDKLKLELNEKKTKIHKVGKSFEFLKARMSMLPNGKIICKMNRRNAKRNRDKLRKLKVKYDEEEISYHEVKEIYETTLGNFKHFNAYRIKLGYTKLFEKLFILGGIKKNELFSMQGI